MTLALAVTQPECYAHFLDEAQGNPRAALQREWEWFEVSHCEAGRRPIHECNLPDAFVDIPSRHHVQQDSGRFDMLGFIRFACALANSIGVAAVRFPMPAGPFFTPDALQRLASDTTAECGRSKPHS
jgi:hypothetical protein